MVEGQVGYHRPDNVKRLVVEKNNSLVRQIEKTKTEAFPNNLAQLQQDRYREIQQEEKQKQKQKLKEERLVAAEAKRRAEELSYDRIFAAAAAAAGNNDADSNIQATVDASAAEDYEDDFM